MRYVCSLLAITFVLSVLRTGRCADDPGSDLRSFNFRIGTQTFVPRYGFSDKTRLVETAEQIQRLPSNILKFELSQRTISNYRLPTTRRPTSLTALARDEESVAKVLQMPFAHYFLWAYPFSTDGPGHYWRDGSSKQTLDREYKELFDLTEFLLTEFDGSGKTFYLGHWEGDWSLLGGVKMDDIPTDTAVQGMIEWLNVRQKAIDDAKAKHAKSDVRVFGYVEVNLVRRALDGKRTVTTVVLPRIDIDYVSYSAWDSLSLDQGSLELSRRLKESLSFIESKLRPRRVPGKRVFLGEFGFPMDIVKTRQAQVQNTRIVLDAALEWGCPFVLYWQMYENEAKEGELGRGQGLIDNTGEHTLAHIMLSSLLTDSNRHVETVNNKNKRPPSDQEYLRFVRTWLASPEMKPSGPGVVRSEPDGATDRLKRKLKGTKWVNENKVTFEWTRDGDFLHKGVEREWKLLDGRRVQIVFGPKHVDTLVFNEELTEFRQLIRGGPDSFQGKRQP